MIQFWKVNKDNDFQSFGQESGRYTPPKHPLKSPTVTRRNTVKQISTIYQKALHKLAFIKDENIEQITHVGIRKKKHKKPGKKSGTALDKSSVDDTVKHSLSWRE